MVSEPINSQGIDMNHPIVTDMLQIREKHARNQRDDYSHVFRPKSRLDLIRLSCITVAIELAYSAETAFVSPILLQTGVDHKHMTMIWGLSPLLGFFISPILGSLSDRCGLKLGRRRPLVIALSTGIMLGLVLVPYGKTLGTLLGDKGFALSSTNSTLTYSAVATPIVESGISKHLFGFLISILGTIILDFNADSCQTPARAYILDVCIPGDHFRAMSTFSLMAGVGGTFGYALGAIDWTSTQIGTFLGGNYQTVFVIVLLVFIACLLITVTSFREIPLDLIESDELLRPLSEADIRKEMEKRKNKLIYYIKEATSMELKLTTMDITHGEKVIYIKENLNNNIINNNNIIKDSICNGSKNITLKIANDKPAEKKITMRTYLKSIFLMPKSIRILCLTNLLCHMSHLSYCLYFTDFVGEAVFGGDPSAPIGSPKEILYNEGVRFGCWGLTVYAISCSIYSMSFEKLISWSNTKTVYVGGILSFSIAMLILAIWPTKIGVLVFSMASGIIYCTLFTVPFVLIAKYHSQGSFRMSSEENVPLQQTRGLATDIAIITSMVFIGQLVISLSMGSLITWLGSTSATLYTASGTGLLAAISALSVLYLD